MIIDVNHLSSDTDYRQTVQRQITDAARVQVDLSDARNTIAFSFVAPGRNGEIADQIKIVGNFIIANAPSPQAQKFASKVLTEFLDKYARYSFYAGQLVAVAGNNGLLGERDCLTVERDGLRAERDGLAAERDGLLTSTSWRLAAPFRASRNLFR